MQAVVVLGPGERLVGKTVCSDTKEREQGKDIGNILPRVRFSGSKEGVWTDFIYSNIEQRPDRDAWVVVMHCLCSILFFCSLERFDSVS
jgi:hypothetical protein